MLRRGVILTIILFLSILSTRSQLIGIDLGTEYTKVAMIHSGAGKSFTIVENMKSQRKIETALAFNNAERFYESEAANKRLRNTVNSFLYTKIFLEQANNASGLIQLSKNLLLEHSHLNEQTNNLMYFVLQNFELQDGSKNIKISIEQVFGMIFKYIKQLAQKHGKTKVKDCVIAIPNYWSLDLRIQILNALAIAQLYPLSVITENTAASIQYAMNRQDNATHRVVFYNLGSNALQVTLAEFRMSNDSKNKVEAIHIIDEYGMNQVGGLNIDVILANHFEKIFQEKHKKTLTKRGKIKLLEQSQKIKEVLSANKDAHMVVEQLSEGIDFQAKITRVEFEKLIEQILQKITEPLNRFIWRNDLRPKEINGVQMIGGSVRIPKLLTTVSKIFEGADVGTHINGDESAALGAVFYAANSSKKFRVKGLQLYDGFNFEVRVVLRNLDETLEEGDEGYMFKNITIFKKKQRFGAIKEIALKCTQNIVTQFYKEDENGLELIKSVKLTNITDYKNKYANETPRLQISLMADPINIISLPQVKVTIQRKELTTYPEQVKKPKKKQPKSEEESEKSQESQNASQADNQTKTNKTKKKQEQFEYKTVERTKTIIKKYQLKVNTEEKWHLRQRLTGQQLIKAQQLLHHFEDEEDKKKKLAEAKNRLQAAIYQGRDLLENKEFIEFSTAQERQTIKSQISEKQEKVYEKNTVQGYTDLYKDMYIHIQKVKTRILQARQRDEVRKRVMTGLGQYLDKYNKLEKDNPWVTEAEKEPLYNLIDSTKRQIQKQYEQQEDKPKNEDPIVWNKNVLKKLDSVKDLYYSIKNIPKPKTKVKYEQIQKEDEKKTEDKKEQKADDKPQDKKEESSTEEQL